MSTQRYVEEVMTRQVVAVRPDVSAAEVARQLTGRRIGAMPVVDGERHVIGIVAESDLLAGGGAGGGTAGEAMTSPAVTVSVGTSVAEASVVLLARDIGRLPVVDGDGGLIGIVSRRDLVRSLMPTEAEMHRQIMDRVADFGGEVYGVSVSGGSVRVRGRVRHSSEIPLLDKFLRETPGVAELELDVVSDVDDMDERE